MTDQTTSAHRDPIRRHTTQETRVNCFNPAIRLAAMAIATTPLLLTVDAVSAGVAVVLEILAAFALGIKPVQLLRRAWPLLLVAPLTGLSMLLYGKPGGHQYAQFLAAHITDNSISLAIAIVIRVFAIGLPAIILTVDLDPTDLGDGLAQIFRLPEKFVVGAVAGVRMVTLFKRDYEAMHRARRARGMADSGRIRRSLSIFFALLVVALRRGGKLATAMEARAFGAPGKRSWARQSRVGLADWLLLLVCVAIPACALGAAWFAGTLRILGG